MNDQELWDKMQRDIERTESDLVSARMEYQMHPGETYYRIQYEKAQKQLQDERDALSRSKALARWQDD